MDCKNERCSFYKFNKNYLNGWGNVNAQYVFVYDSPEDDDIKNKKLLSGNFGVFVKKLLNQVGISITDCYFTTALKCKSKNWRSSIVKNEDIFLCNEILRIELSNLSNKKLIVALGNIALRSLLKSKTAQITKYRGVFYDTSFGKVFPTFNIGALYNSPQYLGVFLHDLFKAKLYVEGKLVNKFNLPKIEIIRDEERLEQILSYIENKVGVLSLDIETSGFNWRKDVIGGVSFCFNDNEAFYVPLLDRGELPIWKDSFSILKRLAQCKAKKVFANGKFDIKFFRFLGIDVTNFYFDVILAHSLIDENLQGMHDIKTLAGLYLGIDKYEQELEDYKKHHKECKENYLLIPIEVLGKYAALDAWVTYELFKIFLRKLHEEDCLDYLLRFQIPLSNFLMRMEENGVYLDEKWAQKLKAECEDELYKLKKQIFEITKREFNLNSPQQLIEVIKELGLKVSKGKVTNGGKISTSEDALEEMQKLNPNHPFPSLLIQYRKKFKVISAFVDGIMKLRDENGRVHPIFSQHEVVTGRVSTREPNLQGIPRDNSVRGLFASPKSDRKIIEVDYNAAEVRVWAYLINDDALKSDFKLGIDIYKAMANRIFGISVEKVTPEQRQQMKGVVLGLMYGRGVWSLADEFKVPVEEAQYIIDSFFQKYPKALQWMNYTKKFLKLNGYVRSPLGRKRRLYGIYSFNPVVVEEAYRQAINFPVQSFSSDLNFLIGMKVYEQMQEKKLDGEPILAVHDSLLFEAAEKDVSEIVKIIEEEVEKMSNQLKIPLVVEVNVGERWQKK
ncbi:MAG: DNA polymerase [Candidatus Aenigmatarchaeota archaeon]